MASTCGPWGRVFFGPGCPEQDIWWLLGGAERARSLQARAWESSPRLFLFLWLQHMVWAAVPSVSLSASPLAVPGGSLGGGAEGVENISGLGLTYPILLATQGRLVWAVCLVRVGAASQSQQGTRRTTATRGQGQLTAVTNPMS